MKTKFSITLSMIVLASAGIMNNASAQEKTRAEVRQELIQAENNGSGFVTDTSYPAVNPIFAQQVARMRQNTSGFGAVMSGSSASGQPAAVRVANDASGAKAACVGPVSFCNLYAGG